MDNQDYSDYNYFMNNILKSDACNLQFDQYKSYVASSNPSASDVTYLTKNCNKFCNGIVN